jgi:hypothetical protein
MTRHKNAQELMEEHDERVRIAAEKDILQTAKSLTNGHAGDPVLTGQVLLWLTGEMVEQGRLLRTVVSDFKSFRKHEDCVMAHAGKMGKVALFGQTYKMPMTAAIICAFLTYLVEKFGG